MVHADPSLEAGHRQNSRSQPFLLKLTNISQVDKAVLADVGAGAGLRLHNGAGVRLFIANDPQLGRLHTARQVYVKNCAQFL